MIKNMRGNVFTVLLGAVALTGALGYMMYQTMAGPVASMSRITRAAASDSQLQSVAKAVLVATMNQAAPDCDGDSYVEPPEFVPVVPTTAAPAGGGVLPAALLSAAAMMDPWNTPYGYCVWDVDASGGGKNDPAVGVGTCPAGAKRLKGSTSFTTGTRINSQLVFGIISAGPNRRFESTCSAYVDADTDVFTRGGDDIAKTLTYREASIAAGDLWNMSTSASATAAINKPLSVTSSDTALPAIRGLALTTDDLITATGGLMLGDQNKAVTCDAGNIALMRYNTGNTTPIKVKQTITGSVVKVPRDTTAGSTTSTGTFPSALAAGSTVIVTFSGRGEGTPVTASVSDSVNTYNTIAATAAVGNAKTYIFAAYGVAAGSPTLTVTLNGGSTARRGSWSAMEVSGLSGVLDTAGTMPLVVTGAVNNGSGLIRLTVPTAGITTGNTFAVATVGGVPNATGTWPVTVIDATHLDLQGSTWAGLYTSGGTISTIPSSTITAIAKSAPQPISAISKASPGVVTFTGTAPVNGDTVLIQGATLAVTGAVSNGAAGLVRLTTGSTASLTTGNTVAVDLVGGVPNATGSWKITVVDGTHIDLLGSTFAGTYTSGGSINPNTNIGMTQVNGNSYKVAGVTATTFQLQDLNGTNVDTTNYSTYTSGGTFLKAPVVTTSAANTFTTGDRVFIQDVVGMTQINGRYFTVASVGVGGANKLQLLGNIDSSAFSTYTSAGSLSYASTKLSAPVTTQNNDLAVAVHGYDDSSGDSNIVYIPGARWIQTAVNNDAYGYTGFSTAYSIVPATGTTVSHTWLHHGHPTGESVMASLATFKGAGTTFNSSGSLEFCTGAPGTWTALGGGGALSAVTKIDELYDGVATYSVAPLYFVGLGKGALELDTTGGTANTAVGYNALMSVTSGTNNTGMGYSAGQGVTTTSNNTYIGSNPAAATATGASATGVGVSALSANTSTGSTAFGFEALKLNTSGINTAFGTSALSAVTTGTGNTAFGYQALKANTASANTAFGYMALAANTTGTQNTAYGYQALMLNATGVGNTAFGYQSLARGKDPVAQVTPMVSSVTDGTNKSTATFGITPSVGSAIIVMVAGYDSHAGGFTLAANNITDNQGGVSGSYILAGTGTFCSLLQKVLIFYRPNITLPTGAFAVTITTGHPGDTVTWGAMEATGLATSSTADQTVSVNTTVNTETSLTATTPATTQADELAVSGLGDCSGNPDTSMVVSTGWITDLYQSNANTNLSALFSHKGLSAVGPASATWNFTSPNNAPSGYDGLEGSVIATFKIVTFTGTTSYNYNSAFGYQTLMNNSSGDGNSAAGYQALKSNTTGSGNTSAGSGALANNTTANGNTAAGYQALNLNTGAGNTAAGSGALAMNTGGSNNTAAGYQALAKNSEAVGGTISVVQATPATAATNAANVAASFPLPVTAGNQVIVMVTGDTWPGPSYFTLPAANVTDSKGGTYSQAVAATSVGTDYEASKILYRTAPLPSSGTLTVSIAPTVSPWSATYGAYEVAGLAAAPFDRMGTGSALATSTSGTVFTSAPTTQANELAISTGPFNTSSAHDCDIQSSVGWTQGILYNDNIAAMCSAFAYKILSASLQTPSNTFTYSQLESGVDKILLMATFKGANSSGAGATDYGNDNTAAGYQALQHSVYGDGNTAVGYQALRQNVASYNTAIGYQALTFNSMGTGNTAAGNWALHANRAGSYNTALGQVALDSSDASYNTAAGDDSMDSPVSLGNRNTGVGSNTINGVTPSSSGVSNVALGPNVMANITSGSYNVAMGIGGNTGGSMGNATSASYDTCAYCGGITSGSYNSGIFDNVTTGNYNTMVGGTYVTTGSNNTAFGVFAVAGNTTVLSGTIANLTGIGAYALGDIVNAGTGNTAVGNGALYANTGSPNTSGTNNTAVGRKSVSGAITTGAGNTGVGNSTLLAITTASNNTAVGDQALAAVTTAAGNTAVGASALLATLTTGAAAVGNNTAVGYLTTTINTSNTGAFGYASAATAAGNYVLGTATTGLIGGAVAYTSPSDRRLKKDIRESDLGLDFVMKLRPVSFRMIQNNARIHYGFIAQEVQKALGLRKTDLAFTDGSKDKMWAISIEELISPVVRAVQERQAAILRQQQEIDDLRGQIDAAEKAVAKMKNRN